MHSEQPRRQQAWNRYWASGALHSCVGSYDGNYGGAIAGFWSQQFTTLSAQMRVLDLGTGNGPLPALMVQHCAPAVLPEIDAVDLAQPQPGWLSSLDQPVRSRIRLHAGVAIEALPFADASFDRIYSQFAFEYAPAEPALDEVLRVLKQGGELAMLMHHADSRLAQVAAEEAAHIRWLLEQSGLVPALRDLLPYAVLAGSPQGVAQLRGDPEANQRRHLFNSLMQTMTQRADKAVAPDIIVDTAQAMIERVQQAPSRGLENSLADLDEWCAALGDAQLRSQELIEHALDETALQGLIGRISAQGFRVACDPIHESDWLVGWALVAR